MGFNIFLNNLDDIYNASAGTSAVGLSHEATRETRVNPHVNFTTADLKQLKNKSLHLNRQDKPKTYLDSIAGISIGLPPAEWDDAS